MKTSIIICFYEKIDYLKYCLDSLRFCSKDFLEVVIADDGSTDEVVTQIKQMLPQYDFPIVHAWHTREGARRSATRNNGIRMSRGDYLVFLDRDNLVLPDTISFHNSSARQGMYLAGRFKNLSQEQTDQIFKVDITTEILEFFYNQMSEKPIQKEHRQFVKYGILRRLNRAYGEKQNFGGHFSLFKKDIESVNGFDENYIGWGGEDLDMARRLAKKGIFGRSIIKNARCMHMWHPHALGNKHWTEGPNIDYFNRKNIPAYCENGLIKKRLS
jgi:glycosyltransferase involved in cell wall biosynthesis